MKKNERKWTLLVASSLRALRQLRQRRWILLTASSSRRRSARSQSQGQVWNGPPWWNQWEINEKSTLLGGFNHVLTILKNMKVSWEYYSHIIPIYYGKKCLKPPASTGKQWTNGFTDWVYDGWSRIWTLDFHELFLDETRRYPRVFPNCSFQPFMEVSDISGEFSPCKNI